MKDVQHGIALLASSAHFSTETTSSNSHSATASSSQVTSATPLGDSPQSLLWNHTNFVDLWHQIFHIVSANSESDIVLVGIAEILGQAFHVDGCVISLPNTQTAGWLAEPTVSRHYFRSVPALFEQPFFASNSIPIVAVDGLPGDISPNSLLSKVVKLWQTVVPSVGSVSIGAVLGVATEFNGNVNGVISLMRSHSQPWADSEIEALQMVSHQVAMVFSQLQLQQQAQFQSVVTQLTMAIRNSSDLGEILKLATDGTASALQVQRSTLWRLRYWDPLFKSRGQESLPQARVSLACEWLRPQLDQSSILMQEGTAIPDGNPNQSFWISECALCQQVFLHPNRLLAIRDRGDLPIAPDTVGIVPAFQLEEFSSLLLAPLESQGTVLGFLAFQHTHPHVWQPEEMKLVELVSAQVSTAIIQTETLRQVQSLVEKRTAELRQSLSVQAKLYERTRQQLDQLRYLNQLKDEFLSTISHELRTPLTSMTMAIRMLRQVGVSSDRSHRYLDILEQQCAQETNLINDLLALQELESQQVSIQPEEIDLVTLIGDLTNSFQQKWAAKGLNIHLDLPDQPLTLRSDRDSINRVLLELLTNAGKYADPNTTIELTVNRILGTPTNHITLTLSNFAPGIDPAELPYIFDKFRRCQGVTQDAIPGTGLGLALVKSLVQLLGGTITASSESVNGTASHKICFKLTLPQFLDSITV